MRRFRLLLAAAVSIAIAGCSVRSISNSGYPDGGGDWAYRGEIQEADLIVPQAGPITEQQIEQTLADRIPVAPQRGNRLVLIQSGALQPDSAMLDVLSRDFQLVPFSGVPQDRSSKEPEDYASRLRLMAAEGGVSQILCYWGELEAGRNGEAGKAVSWLPIVGAIVPDETQHMRIVLRAVLLDVATGGAGACSRRRRSTTNGCPPRPRAGAATSHRSNSSSARAMPAWLGASSRRPARVAPVAAASRRLKASRRVAMPRAVEFGRA
ncbi:MAG TPA: hypothetical protein VKS60_06680 [Stellaceae bacterium]|nr:hypothetical protein [Stellaceae bacterium]